MNTVTVKIGGKERPFKFGFAAISEFGKMTDRKINDLSDFGNGNYSLYEMLVLFWCGLKHGSRNEKEEFNITIDEVGDWLDEDPTIIISLTAAIRTEMDKIAVKGANIKSLHKRRN